MSNTLASLRRKIARAGDLQSLVHTMKAVAGSNVGQYENARARWTIPIGPSSSGWGLVGTILARSTAPHDRGDLAELHALFYNRPTPGPGFGPVHQPLDDRLATAAC